MAGVRACVFCACERLYTHEHARRMRACVRACMRGRKSERTKERGCIRVRERGRSRVVAREGRVSRDSHFRERASAGGRYESFYRRLKYFYSSRCYRRSPNFHDFRMSLCILERNRFLVRSHYVNILSTLMIICKITPFFLSWHWTTAPIFLQTRDLASTLHCKFQYEAFALCEWHKSIFQISLIGDAISFEY